MQMGIPHYQRHSPNSIPKGFLCLASCQTCSVGVLASGYGGYAILGTDPETLRCDLLCFFSRSCILSAGVNLSIVQFWLFVQYDVSILLFSQNTTVRHKEEEVHTRNPVHH